MAGPIVAFYAGWKLAGLGGGIVAGTLVAIALFVWERRRGRSGLGASLGLGMAGVQAVAGFLSGTAIGYLAPPVIANGLYGLVFIGSVLIGQPLAGVFAAETYPFPQELRSSPLFRRVFSIVSLAWGLVFLARCLLRLGILSRGDVDVFVLVNLATGLPLNVALMVWSFWYPLRRFRRALAAV